MTIVIFAAHSAGCYHKTYELFMLSVWQVN